jgi:hypothetical protein
MVRRSGNGPNTLSISLTERPVKTSPLADERLTFRETVNVIVSRATILYRRSELVREARVRRVDFGTSPASRGNGYGRSTG